MELPGCCAGAAADVDHITTGAGRDDPVHQGFWIRRPGAVVAFGVLFADRIGAPPEAGAVSKMVTTLLAGALRERLLPHPLRTYRADWR